MALFRNLQSRKRHLDDDDDDDIPVSQLDPKKRKTISLSSSEDEERRRQKETKQKMTKGIDKGFKRRRDTPNTPVTRTDHKESYINQLFVK